MVRRMRSRVSSGSRSGCKASPSWRVKHCDPQIVSISCTSSASAIAGKHTTSHGSWPSTWPTRSSVEPLHDDHDRAVLLVILSAVESVIVPFVSGLPLRRGERLLRLQRIVDNDD